MKRTSSMTGALVATLLLVAAGTTAARADEVPAQDVEVPAAEAPAPAAPAPEPEPEKPAEPFHPTVYFGGGFGVADQDKTDYGWALWTLTRPFRYGAFQLEYFNLNSDRRNDGDYDGLYLGIAPILPLTDHLALMGELGYGFSNRDDDIAGGAGVLYKLPFEAVDKVINGGVSLRADYKYFNFDEEAHLVTFGAMVGFSK